MDNSDLVWVLLSRWKTNHYDYAHSIVLLTPDFDAAKEEKKKREKTDETIIGPFVYNKVTNTLHIPLADFIQTPPRKPRTSGRG